MKKSRFYLSLNLLNILLSISTIIMAYVFWWSLHIDFVKPICLFVLCIFAKIFLLYSLFIIVEKFFPVSALTVVSEKLKNNTSDRKYALILSFVYDVVVMMYFVFSSVTPFWIEIFSFPIFWEIITLGGVCMFYITLFEIWKIQGKLK